jgi:TRAP-type C4-dicarboxylate transport system substrate-binding protein
MNRGNDKLRITVRGVVPVVLLTILIMICTVPTSSRAAEKVLRFATTAAATDCGSVGLAGWMDEVEKRTNGAVKFEKFWAGSLVPGAQILTGIDSGVADMGQLILSYYMSTLPLHTVVSVPGTGGYGGWARAQGFMHLYDRVPELRAELARYHAIPLAIRGSALGLNLLSKKAVRQLADIKGMKIRSTGYAQNMVTELGGVPVGVSWDEIYTAFDRGTVQATLQDLSGFTGLKLYEVGKYLTMLGLSDTQIVIAIRKEVFDSLPESVRKVMLDLAEEEGITSVMRAYYNCPESLETYNFKTGTWQKAGVEIINLSPDDQTRLKAAEANVRAKWITEMRGKGFEAEKIYNAFVELCTQWEKRTPKEFQGK